MAWLFLGLVLIAGFGLLWWGHLRSRRRPPVREAAPGCSVSELTAGRFRVTGTVVPIRTVPSAVDESPCVFLEQAEYRTVGSELVPLLREVERRLFAHPFYVDDGTGRVWVDPASASLETVTLYEDEGLLAERRLRAGEEVELIARFEPRPVESDGGPYRADAMGWEAVRGPFGPPRLNYRIEPGGTLAYDDFGALMKGIGAFMLLLGFLGGVLGLM